MCAFEELVKRKIQEGLAVIPNRWVLPPPPKAKPIKPLDRCSYYQRDRIRHRLNKWAGRKVLGQGAFGTAFDHKDPTKVIKVGPLNDGWLLWAAYCNLNAGRSPHLMRVYSIRRYEKHGIYVAVIERLQMTVYMGAGRGGSTECIYPELIGWEALKYWFRGDSFSTPSQREMDRFIAAIKCDTLIPFLLPIKGFALDNGLGRDLHDENAMLRVRPDGTYDIVITDPFSSSSDEAAKKLATITQTSEQ